MHSVPHVSHTTRNTHTAYGDLTLILLLPDVWFLSERFCSLVLTFCCICVAHDTKNHIERPWICYVSDTKQIFASARSNVKDPDVFGLTFLSSSKSLPPILAEKRNNQARCATATSYALGVSKKKK